MSGQQRLPEFDRAKDFSATALKVLRAGNIPPLPEYYELLFTYATGSNPDLNAKINSVIEAGGVPDQTLAEQLYSDYLKSRDLENKLSVVSGEISNKIAVVSGAIDVAMDAANNYSGKLETASGSLNSGVDPLALKRIVELLLSETDAMRRSNSELESRLAGSIADISALRADLEEVRLESMVDPMTKVFNRRSFDQALVKAANDATFNGHPMALAMIDIDHFKKFNDHWGHQTGDQVLRLVASMLKAGTREEDTAARYGGEEFALVLPNTDRDGAHVVAENIRQAVESRELRKRTTNEMLGRITVSVGIASFEPGDTPASILDRADKCLYAAKAAGRNCIVDDPAIGRAEKAKAGRAA